MGEAPRPKHSGRDFARWTNHVQGNGDDDKAVYLYVTEELERHI